MRFSAIIGIFLLVVHGTDAGMSMNNPFFCYMTDPIRSMTTMHSISTSYEAIRRFNLPTVRPRASTCTPSRFWYLGRYGGRFPFPDLMQEMIQFSESSIQQDIVDNYIAGRTSLCRQDFEAIRDWTRAANFTIQNASLATEAAVVTMQNIARRYQQTYPDILTITYSPDRFHFRHTNTERTNTSIRAFAEALFGTAAQNVVYDDVPERDWFLRPFDYCPAFREDVENYAAHEEALRYGPEFEEVLDNINRKLGFHGTNQLSFETIFVMWEWCRFETASTFEFSGSETGGDSVWCAPFSVADNLLFEYIEDLGHFYFSGYGVRNRRLLENMMCGLMQDLLNLINSDDSNDTVARIFVCYTQEIQAMLVALGTFRDDWPLHEHNYAQQSGRNWFTSRISSLGSNLAVVRYDCDDDDDDLVFLINEKPILVPGCDEQTGVCKTSVFLNRFKRFIEADCEEFFCSSK